MQPLRSKYAINRGYFMESAGVRYFFFFFAATHLPQNDNENEVSAF